MDEKELQDLASQFSCPDGDAGLEIAKQMNELNEFITQKAIDALAPQQGETLVEIGPGNAVLSLPILKALGDTGRYLAVEMSAAMAEQARINLRDEDCHVEIYNSSCSDTDIRASSIDALLAVNVLYFIDNLDEFFHQLFLWMKPGGRVVFAIRPEKTLESLPFTQYVFNIRNTQTYVSAMERVGFECLEPVVFDEGVLALADIEVPVATVILLAKKP
ncbi:class I SAM-dependent methyltransferase [Agaribacterium sp. ZY112]|uniref:class I SAM-dependent methyltransferase n=1 Tax=Agaribacterium sp. ZY112 TaxID=3233574 RepID=UPI0035250501